MKKILNIFVKFIIIFLLILTFVFAYLSIFHKELLLDYLDKFKTVVSSLWNWNYFIIFAFWFIESFPLLWIAVPGQMVLIAIAGIFWVLWVDHIIYSILCAGFWAVLWNYVWYLMWLKYWDSFFEKYGNWIWIGKTDIKYIKKWIDSKWWLFVVFGKFHNLFRAFVPFIAWTSKMHSWKFAFANIFGSFLRAIVMVILWVFFVKNAETIISNIWKIFLWIVLMFLIYIYFFKKEEFMKYWEEKNKEMEKMFETK